MISNKMYNLLQKSEYILEFKCKVQYQQTNILTSFAERKHTIIHNAALLMPVIATP